MIIIPNGIYGAIFLVTLSLLPFSFLFELPLSAFSCRIHRTLSVPGDFCARNSPVSRTYLYRFAVRKPEFAKEPEFNPGRLSTFSPLARDDVAIVQKPG